MFVLTCSLTIVSAQDSVFRDRSPLPAFVHDQAEIESLPSDTFVLRARRLDANGIRAIAGLRHLEWLELSGLCLEDEPLRDYSLPPNTLGLIAQLPRLKVLSLRVIENLQAFELRKLERIPTLTSIRLEHIDDLSDAHVAACSHLPALRGLHLEGRGDISDEGMARIGTLIGLNHLSLRGSFEVTEIGYRELARLKRLRSLDLSVPWYLWGRGSLASGQANGDGPLELGRFDDGALIALAPLKQLRSLSLGYRFAVTNASMPTLGSFAKLRHLDLRGCSSLTDDGLAHLPRQLESLNVARCNAVESIPEQLTELQILNAFEMPALSDSGLTSISEMPKLRKLQLYACPGITKASLPVIAKLTHLTHLSVAGASWLDDSAVQTLSRLRELRLLNVGGFASVFRIEGTSITAGGPTAITAMGVAALKKLKHLEELRLSAAQPMKVAALRELECLPLRKLVLNWVDISYDEETPGLTALRARWQDVDLHWWPPIADDSRMSGLDRGR